MALKIDQLRRFTVDEYMRMARDGILPPDERTELLEGRIVLKMSQDASHVGGIALGNQVLVAALGTSHFVVPQVTVRMTRWSAPEPDFVVISRDRWQPGQDLTTGDLLVEVSNSSLDVDRENKASLYALASVPEYWIVNLVERCVESYRDPAHGADGVYGAGYRTVTRHMAGDRVSPLCRPDVRIAVSDLLPVVKPPEQP